MCKAITRLSTAFQALARWAHPTPLNPQPLYAAVAENVGNLYWHGVLNGGEYFAGRRFLRFYGVLHWIIAPMVAARGGQYRVSRE